jgi:tetratricopeptide (TPR) repeat protein
VPLSPPAAAVSSADVPREAADRYLAGVYHWSTRTPAGLKQARADFDEAIAIAPAYAPAYVGLANTYNLLSQYTVMPASEAYPLAMKSAERALALDDRSADGYAALAFTTFYWLHDIARAEVLFRKSLALNPNSSQTLHWYALVTMHTGDMAEPIRAITRALELEPSARSIVANRGLILFHAGRIEEARKLLEDLEESAPDFLPPHAYLATIHLASQQYEDYLREAGEQARLEGDEAAQDNLAAAARALHTSGPAAMLETVLTAEEKAHAAGRESAFNVARTAALLGDRQKVFAYLQRSREAGEPDILGIRIDPAFKAIRTDTEFVAIADAVLPRTPTRNG